MKLKARTNRGGIALIVVMIAITALSMLAAAFAISMKVETKLARNADSEAELTWLGRSGVEYARWILAQQLRCPSEPFDSLEQTWAGGTGGLCASNGPLAGISLQNYHLGNGSFSIKITDLERKININIADETILDQALRVVGLDESEIPTISASILDWIDPDENTHVGGAESDFYQTLDPPYYAKDAPIDDLSELLLVKGIRDQPEMYSAEYRPATIQKVDRFGRDIEAPNYPVHLLDLFTPISSGRINLNTASAEVLQVVTGVDPDCAGQIVASRGGTDDGSGLMGPYRSVDQVRRVPCVTIPVYNHILRVCDVHSRTFEVEVDADIGGHRRVFKAILGRNSPQDVQVLSFYWKE